jgi:hypothetical protein
MYIDIRVLKPEIFAVPSFSTEIAVLKPYNPGEFMDIDDEPIARSDINAEHYQIYKIVNMIDDLEAEEIFFVIVDKDIETYIDSQFEALERRNIIIQKLEHELSCRKIDLSLAQKIIELYNAYGFWKNIKIWFHRRRVELDLNKVIGKPTTSHTNYMKLINKELK